MNGSTRLENLCRAWPQLCAAVWVGVSVCGIGLVVRESFDPGQPGAGSSVWPVESSLPRETDVSTAVVFLDPRCGCSRASIAEMARLAHQLGSQTQWIAVVHGAPERTSDGVLSPMHRSLLQIPGVRVYADPTGEEMRRFGASVSGELLLYNAAGGLQFQGGVTPARGHEGESLGALAVKDWVQQGRAECSNSLVFGCQLSSLEGLTP